MQRSMNDDSRTKNFNSLHVIDLIIAKIDSPALAAIASSFEANERDGIIGSTFSPRKPHQEENFISCLMKENGHTTGGVCISPTSGIQECVNRPLWVDLDDHPHLG